MKTLYTILFFADTLIMVLLTYFLLKWIDRGIGELTFAAFICGIIICIILLVYILVRFIKVSDSKLPD